MTSIEKTDIRNISDRLDLNIREQITIATVDVSFIGLDKVLPSVWEYIPNLTSMYLLYKPQFCVGPEHVGRNGVVKDQIRSWKKLEEIQLLCQENGWAIQGCEPSKIEGEAGNQEWMVGVKK